MCVIDIDQDSKAMEILSKKPGFVVYPNINKIIHKDRFSDNICVLSQITILD